MSDSTLYVRNHTPRDIADLIRDAILETVMDANFRMLDPEVQQIKMSDTILDAMKACGINLLLVDTREDN